MPALTSKTKQMVIRVPIPHHRHMEEKAKKNPNNKFNFPGSEVKDLIEKDFNEAQKKAHHKK